MKLPNSLAILDQALVEKQLSGFALALRCGRETFFDWGGCHAYPSSGGIASPVAEGSLFDLASLTKIFVTTRLVHRAKRAGLLRLSDPFQKYFPDFPHREITL